MPDADSDMDRIRIEKAVRDSQDMEFALMEPSADRNLRALAEFFHQCLRFPGIGECVLQMGEDLLRRIEAVEVLTGSWSPAYRAPLGDLV